MKDERAETGTKKKASRRTPARAGNGKKETAAVPRRAKAAAPSPAKKRSRRAAAVEASTAEHRAQPRPRRPALTEAQRQAMVAERAYLKAERRGFRGGDPVQDWFEAEAEVDALILRGGEES